MLDRSYLLAAGMRKRVTRHAKRLLENAMNIIRREDVSEEWVRAGKGPREGAPYHQFLMMRRIMREQAEQDHTCHGTQNNAIKPREMLDQYHRTLLLTMIHLHRCNNETVRLVPFFVKF